MQLSRNAVLRENLRNGRPCPALAYPCEQEHPLCLRQAAQGGEHRLPCPTVVPPCNGGTATECHSVWHVRRDHQDRPLRLEQGGFEGLLDRPVIARGGPWEDQEVGAMPPLRDAASAWPAR